MENPVIRFWAIKMYFQKGLSKFPFFSFIINFFLVQKLTSSITRPKLTVYNDNCWGNAMAFCSPFLKLSPY